MDSTAQIEHEAAAWLTKRDSGGWSENDRSALARWLEAATANRVAFLRLEAAWDETLRLKALAAGIPSGAGESREWRLPVYELPSGEARAVAQRNVKVLAIAASVLAVIGIGGYLGAEWFRGERYSTPAGGTASVPLEDGSHVTLNTASRIRVELNARERHIELAQGEAFFDVAKDPARPFVVSAGEKRVVAVGTAFSVRRERDDVRVVVTEGKVKVEDAARATSGFLVAAGGVAKTGDSGVSLQKKTPSEAEEILSWRSGFLSFHDTPLVEAITEFNQYNSRKIAVEDPGVGSIPLSGKFKATNYEAFLRLLRDGYAIQARRAGDKIVLSDARTQ